jgi:hypothetical protein
MNGTHALSRAVTNAAVAKIRTGTGMLYQPNINKKINSCDLACLHQFRLHISYHLATVYRWGMQHAHHGSPYNIPIKTASITPVRFNKSKKKPSFSSKMDET